MFEGLVSNSYPGRGILLGRIGNQNVIAYFIMGRSVNSRNRIFVTDGEGIRTEAKDPSKLTDPSLIIYAPVRVIGSKTIVTNGDQTDTVYDHILEGKTFEDALRTRCYEPDAPNFTPRISGLVEGDSMKLSILKYDGGACVREFFEYEATDGIGRLIHTYEMDGNPIPSFSGEPKVEHIEGDIDTFTSTLWEALDSDNKVALFVRYIDVETGVTDTRIVNR